MNTSAAIAQTIDQLIDQVSEATAAELRDALTMLGVLGTNPNYRTDLQRQLCRDLAYTLRLHAKFSMPSPAQTPATDRLRDIAADLDVCASNLSGNREGLSTDDIAKMIADAAVQIRDVTL